MDALVAACETEGVPNPRSQGANRRRRGSRSQADLRTSLERVPERERRATVLSFGAGRDSSVLAIILAAYDDPWLVKRYPQAAKEAKRYRHDHPWLDVVGCFSDTGYEFPFSYEAFDAVKRFVDRSRHPYTVLTLKKPDVPWRDMMEAARGPSMRPRSRGRTEIMENQPWTWGVPGESPERAAERGKYHTKPPIPWEHTLSGTMTARDNASCTFGQKIDPIKRFIQDLSARLEPGIVTPWRQGSVEHTIEPWTRLVEQGLRLPHRSIIGINADEIGRADLRTGGRWPARVVPYDTCSWARGRGAHHYTVKRGYDGACYRDSVAEYHYPLIDWGIGEAEEQEILAHYGLDWIRKSGCMSCHWQSPGWWWAEKIAYPDEYERSVAMEIGGLLRRQTQIEIIVGVIEASVERTGKLNARSVRKDVIDRLGSLTWRQMEGWARARQLGMGKYLKAVLSGEISPVKPMLLGSFRNYPLPCIVAWFAEANPDADPQTVFDKAYTRKGGAANLYCDCEKQA